jgi:diphosphate-dependent phosphofructokinase
LISFSNITGGTEGLFAQKTMEIADDILSSYKNQGGLRF